MQLVGYENCGCGCLIEIS